MVNIVLCTLATESIIILYYYFLLFSLFRLNKKSIPNFDVVNTNKEKNPKVNKSTHINLHVNQLYVLHVSVIDDAFFWKLERTVATSFTSGYTICNILNAVLYFPGNKAYPILAIKTTL